MEGPVMGTRWSADLGLPTGTDPRPIKTALAASVTQVDAQMSTWKPGSDLSLLNAAPVGQWLDIPQAMMRVLERGLEIGRASGGAFDIGLGDLVSAWGFGAQSPDERTIRAKLGQERRPAHEVLKLDTAKQRACKLVPLALDLCAIAKGFAVDQMMAVCDDFGVTSALLTLDGELRTRGLQVDAKPWSVAIEKPVYGDRQRFATLELGDVAVATSGDYRQWVDVGSARFSHSMDLRRGGPVQPGIAGVTVFADDCMTADAMATAILVLGAEAGRAFARAQELECLILERTDSGGIKACGTGGLSQLDMGEPGQVARR